MLFNETQQIRMARFRPKEPGYYIVIPINTKIPVCVRIERDPQNEKELYYFDEKQKKISVKSVPISTKWSKVITFLPIEKL
jgi:hypothetical protein